MKLKPTSFQIAAIVIVITHLVGIVGYLSEWRTYFVAITPLHLLLSAGLLVAHQHQKNKAFWWTICALALAGYLVEVAGIHTGVIFGAYSYDHALGPKIFETPPMIGVNWMMLVLALGSLLSRLQIPNLIRAMLGALCMVALDYLIEPVAMKYDFWHWERTTVPTHNYLGWLITAFLMFLIYFQSPFPKRNKLALVLLVMQFCFFGILNLFL